MKRTKLSAYAATAQRAGLICSTSGKAITQQQQVEVADFMTKRRNKIIDGQDFMTEQSLNSHGVESLAHIQTAGWPGRPAPCLLDFCSLQ